MCGISGIVGKNWKRADLETMVRSQNHRGPDANGIFVNETATVGLGHNRLSIIDLSSAGRQPMHNYDRSVWIVFNGEVYNYLELREQLTDYPYQSRTDSETILAAYERWEEKCVEHFVGMFSFAIWDERRQKLFCARDRLGIKPFNYVWQEEKFIFASEIKAILAAGHSASPNWKTWAEYLTRGYYDHCDDTFFEDVKTLPAGHTLTLERGKLKISSYWDLPSLACDTLTLSDDEAAERFNEVFDDAVRLRLRSDVPLGVNLSGGLDSASLMVSVDRMLGHRSDGDVQTFTASFGDPKYDEREFASQVPRRNRWARNYQRLTEEKVWQLAADTLRHQEAPYGGIATLAYHHLHQLAKENNVTVLLEGQGVDEMLGGYDYFLPHYHLDLLEQGQHHRLRQELRASKSAEQSLNAMRRVRSNGEHSTYQDGSSHLKLECVSPEIKNLPVDVPRFDEPFKDRLTNALYRDLRYTKLPRVLRMNDRLSMAFSRELREPYLDHRVVEYLFRLPASQKIRFGRGKYLLRHAMSDRLPDGVRLARKRSVVTPQREWLRTSLRPAIEGVIGSKSFASRGIFDVASVKSHYDRFCAGDGDNAFFVWQWVNTELWFRHYIDREPIDVWD